VDALVPLDRAREAARDPADRVATALALGRRDLLLHAAAAGLSPADARRAVEQRRQARRRPSAALSALVA
jgi:hypothetical protein